MNIKLMAVIVPLALSVSACGDTWGPRAATGAGIGAGSGAVLGLVTGFPIIGSAVVGGLIGAGVGAATTPGMDKGGK